VLLATLVASGENQRRELSQPAASATVPVPPAQESSEELDVEKLQRPRRADAIVDVFAARTPPVPAPVPVAAPIVVPEPSPPPAPPAAPPLPFRFVGKFVEEGATRLLLASGEKEVEVSGGETLDGIYRVESVSADSVVFIYLPLNAAQTLELTADSR
jgi:hypothetical protein